MAMPAASAAGKSWRIIPRPLMETILNNYAHHHRVPKPLLLHGPRGVGKTSIVSGLLHRWNDGPHVAGYLDCGGGAGAGEAPWASFSASVPPADLPVLHAELVRELEGMAARGVSLGAIGSRDVFSALNRGHGLQSALRRLVGTSSGSPSSLWARAVALRSRGGDAAVMASLIPASPEGESSPEEVEYMREAAAALGLAKEVVELHARWRAEAVRDLNRKGGFSMTLAHSSTDWPCLLLEILSQAAEVDFFQPKLIINNIEVLRKAVSTDDSMVSAALYHDSFLWRLISLGVNESCLPVFIVTSDSYYSYQAFIDFGFKDIFLSRETFGWTPQEAKVHTISDFFTQSEWAVIDEVLGPNPRQLSELYVLKQRSCFQEDVHWGSSFEEIVDAYLAYLQVTVVNPAMESVLAAVQKFAFDAREEKLLDDQLSFGAPWRHPPRSNDPATSLRWAKIQLMDFVQSFVNAEFGLNYLADYSFEILDDPCAAALLEVGLLYKQRDPSIIRPINRGIQRCLVRWLVQEKMQMSLAESMMFRWQRIVRGRSYRHLMKQIGYK